MAHHLVQRSVCIFHIKNNVQNDKHQRAAHRLKKEKEETKECAICLIGF